MREFAKRFYNSRAWKDTRKAFGESRFWICEDCGKPAGEVHHIKPIQPWNINNSSISLSWDNLACLCHECHMKRHQQAPTAEGLMFDETGQLVKKEKHLSLPL